MTCKKHTRYVDFPPSSVDPPLMSQHIYQSLIALLDYEGQDVEEQFMLTFQISYEFYGSSQTYDLLPGGDEIPVNFENKELFVDLYVKYLLEDSVREQFEAFKKGFDDVCKGIV